MAGLDLHPFDVVVVPFPFTDRTSSKRRPALVLTSQTFNTSAGNSVLAMITSAEQSGWLGDVPITQLESAGLHSDCLIRLKLFTLDHRLVLRRVGSLAAIDQKKLRSAWKPLLAI